LSYHEPPGFEKGAGTNRTQARFESFITVNCKTPLTKPQVRIIILHTDKGVWAHGICVSCGARAFFSFPLFSGRCRAASGVLHFPGRGIAWENAGRGPGGKRPAEKGRLGTCCEKAWTAPASPRGARYPPSFPKAASAAAARTSSAPSP